MLGYLLGPGDPPQPQFQAAKGGLSSDWVQYLQTPFVRDTLARLVGDVPVSVQSRMGGGLTRPDLAGVTSPRGDLISMFVPPSDDFFSHEVGHVLDVRNLAPAVSSNLYALYQQNRNRATDEYARTNEYEYIAEAFRHAVNVFRVADAAQRKAAADDAETSVPGTGLWLDWLKQKFAPQPKN